MSLTLTTAASNVARVAHYVVPTGQTQPIPTLLLEGQRTNLALRSEEFNDAAWVKVNSATVTSNSTVAPDGTLTADTIVGAAGVASYITQVATVAASSDVSISVYVYPGTASSFRIRYFNASESVEHAGAIIGWSGGVPSTSSTTGTWAIAPTYTSLGTGWYRIEGRFNVGAETTVRASLYPNASSNTTTSVFWGAQIEVGTHSSSYIKTEGTAVTRNADALYFPYTAPPQAMTVYIRGVEMLQGTQPADATLVHFGAASASVDPRCSVYRFAAGNGYRALHDPAAAVTATTAATIERNTLLECRTVLGTNGSVLIGAAKNNGAEVLSPVSSANPFGSAWADTRLWLNSAGVSSTGFFGFTHVVVAKGEQSMDTMRQLAGVV